VVEEVLCETGEHGHIVLGIPKRLRIFFRYDRSLLKYMYSAAWASLKELGLEGRMGWFVQRIIQSLKQTVDTVYR